MPKPTYYRVAPAAGVNASISDMAQWLLAQTGHRPDVLPAPLLATLHAPLVATPGEMRGSSWRRERLIVGRLRAGLARVRLRRPPAWSSTAARCRAIAALMALLPERDLGIVILWNSESALPSGLLPTILDRAIGLPAQRWLDVAPSDDRRCTRSQPAPTRRSGRRRLGFDCGVAAKHATRGIDESTRRAASARFRFARPKKNPSPPGHAGRGFDYGYRVTYIIGMTGAGIVDRSRHCATGLAAFLAAGFLAAFLAAGFLAAFFAAFFAAAFLAAFLRSLLAQPSWRSLLGSLLGGLADGLLRGLLRDLLGTAFLRPAFFATFLAPPSWRPASSAAFFAAFLAALRTAFLATFLRAPSWSPSWRTSSQLSSWPWDGSSSVDLLGFRTAQFEATPRESDPRPTAGAHRRAGTDSGMPRAPTVRGNKKPAAQGVAGSLIGCRLRFREGNEARVHRFDVRAEVRVVLARCRFVVTHSFRRVSACGET